MKLIDRKGRLFGIVNLIDLLFLLVIIATVVFGVKRLGGNDRLAKQESVQGTVSYMIKGVTDISVQNIHEGDKLYHYDKGTYIGEIKKVTVGPYNDPVEGNGEWIDAPVPGKFNVYIDVDAQVEESDLTFTVGGEQTKVGNEYRMKTKSSAFFGTCTGIAVE